MDIQILISNIVVAIGLIFIIFGAIGLFRFKDFYPRILMSTKIDTVGMITLLVGVGIRHGFSFFTAKLALIFLIILILNPLVAHVMARAAFASGYKIKGELREVSDGERDSVGDFNKPIEMKTEMEGEV
ncbi:MAG: monovalent cation/H(+) antiporter subunit G [Defluviitaleaceae bacterium]|nr:monovalent cation/H(+) antiporter subunit G [Defluviitaleaceae bacterium]